MFQVCDRNDFPSTDLVNQIRQVLTFEEESASDQSESTLESCGQFLLTGGIKTEQRTLLPWETRRVSRFNHS